MDILNKDEAQKLSKYLFNFNSKENVYNTLGLGVASMLNSFARKSTMDNLPVLQVIGGSKRGKSKTLKILNLLFNNTNFALVKYFDETYLPIFIDEVKISKSSSCKIKSLSNHISSITEGHHVIKDRNDLTLHKYTYNSSLIISGEEIKDISVKSRSNIVTYSLSDFNTETKESMEFLCNSEDGEELLRRFSKSLYLQVLNYYIDGAFDNEYLITRFKYYFDEKLSLINSREINTAIYTMMGIVLIYNTFESLGVEINKIINLEEVSNIIVSNIKLNVIEDN